MWAPSGNMERLWKEPDQFEIIIFTKTPAHLEVTLNKMKENYLTINYKNSIEKTECTYFLLCL